MTVQKAIDLTGRMEFRQAGKKIVFTPYITQMFQDITKLAASNADSAADSIGKLLESHLSRPLVSEFEWQKKQDYYDRFVVCGSKEHEITLMALIWPSGTISPLHYHQAWCVFGIYAGALIETTYTSGNANTNQLAGNLIKNYNKNSWAYDAAKEKYCHRLGNNGSEPAISFHIYGVSPDNLHKINCPVRQNEDALL